jgi:hypothetical protein
MVGEEEKDWQKERDEARERIRLLEEKVKVLEAMVANLSPGVPLPADVPSMPPPSEALADANQPEAEQGNFEPAARLVGPVETLDAPDAPSTSPRRSEGIYVSDVSTFFEPLSSYGIWQNVPGYGFVWSPSNTWAGWRPYVDGRWCATDRGWMWLSNEPHGWATYHYGRWCQLREVGWVWVPGCEWGPAWVSWRSGGDYCGWAPLPPETLRASSLDPWVDSYYDIGPGLYVFVKTSRLGGKSYRDCLEDPALNQQRVRESMNLTKIMESANGKGGRLHLGGFDPRLVAEQAGPMLRYEVDFAGSARRPSDTGYEMQDNRLLVSSPPPTTAAMGRPRVYRSFQKVDLNRGWDGVRDPDELRSTVRNNTARIVTHEGKSIPLDAAPAAATRPAATGTANPAPAVQPARTGSVPAARPVATPASPRAGSSPFPSPPSSTGVRGSAAPGTITPSPAPAQGPPAYSPAMEQILRIRKK